MRVALFVRLQREGGGQSGGVGGSGAKAATSGRRPDGSPRQTTVLLVFFSTDEAHWPPETRGGGEDCCSFSSADLRSPPGLIKSVIRQTENALAPPSKTTSGDLFFFNPPLTQSSLFQLGQQLCTSPPLPPVLAALSGVCP